MAKTDRFREQHGELVMIVKDISKQLNPSTLAQDSKTAANLLAKLLGKLKIHLAMEDEVLYPQLLAHKDDKIKTTALQYQREMGSIKPVVDAYGQKWSSAIAISKNPEGFITETKGLFDALAKRIEKENNELYPMLDKAA